MAALSNLVRVVSTTTGTGTVTLGSAVVGFLTPSQGGMVDGAVYSYAIEADYTTVGDDLVPVNRECGTGTYASGAGTLTRSVVNSTNGNALLNLAGDAQVFITPLTASFRELLTANRNYYVRTDGSNSNSGFANTAGGAFLTLQKAMDVISGNLDLAGFTVTVNVGAGTYTAGVVCNGWVGGGTVYFLGDNATPANVVVSVTATDCFKINSPMPGIFWIDGFKLVNATSHDCINHGGAGAVAIGGIEFGACAWYHMQIQNPGGSIILFQNYNITGGALAHMYAQPEGSYFAGDGVVVTLSGTLTFTTFAWAARGEISWQSGGSFSGGTISGVRYRVENGGGIVTGGGGANFFPGNSAGIGGTTTGAGFYS